MSYEEENKPVETPPAPNYPKYILLKGEDNSTGVICKLSSSAIAKIEGEYTAIAQGLISPMRTLFKEIAED